MSLIEIAFYCNTIDRGACTMSVRKRHIPVAVTVWILTTIFAFIHPSKGLGEFRISTYGGGADTGKTDVRLTFPGGTNLTFNNVPWGDESFESPFYYGLRVTYWLNSHPGWGVGVDFTHAKMLARLDDTVTIQGTRGGLPVDTREPLGNTFQELAFSHGYNTLILNGFYRWFPKGEKDHTLLGRIQPYGGFGLGLSIPHVEVKTGGTSTEEYAVGGLAFQGIIGVNLDIIGPLSLFPEYKVSYSNISVDLRGGGSLHVSPWTQHFVIGISISF